MDEQEQQPQTSNGNNDESNETPETKPSKNTDNLVKDGDILPGCSTFEDFIQAAYPIVMNGVKASNALPNHQQYSYYKTYSEFEEEMKNEGKKLQDIMQMLLKYVGTKRVIHDQPQQEKFDLIVDANDKLLDRALKKMSQLDGTRFNPDDDFGEAPQEKSKKEISGSWNKNALDAAAKKGVNNDKDNESVKLIAQQKTIRPQALFKDKIDNRNIPWEPRIKEKPNALKPLDITLTVNDQGQDVYTHPYQFELDNWKPEEDRLTMVHDTYVPKEIDDTPLIFVQTEKELQLMVADLLQQREFGVDLEHHSYRSFMGFTCLMQISTKETDYLIDTLKLRDKMYILNSVFTKPNILKIFHGGGSDIDWLQRDFSVYVVNMFDTYQAAKVLEYPKLGLAFLLKQFCQVEANKKFQLYDWRTRPLPEKAKHYARQDTHYLIYIYQQMNNELFAKAGGKANLIEVVYNKSTDICKRVYVKPLLDENSYMNLYRRMQRPFDARQLFALKEIYKWRDNIARQEDESPGYVLSNHMMMQIAQTLPREVQGILACCNPIPPLVRQHAVDIHNIILQAKEVPLVKSLPDESAKQRNELASRDLDLEIRLNYYTHDNTGIELSDDLPTILNGNILDLGDPPEVEPKLPLLSLKSVETEMDQVTKRMTKISFVPPYERYKKVLPYSIQQEKEQLELDKKKEAALADRRNQMQNMPSYSAVTQRSPAKRHAALANDSTPQQDDLPKKLRLTGKLEEASIDHLLTTIKREVDEERSKSIPSKHDTKHKPITPTIGVVGGEISVSKADNNINKKKKKSSFVLNQRQPDFEPYDYKTVDFNKFQSGTSQQNRISIPNQKINRGKRKQQFQGRNQPNKKRQMW